MSTYTSVPLRIQGHHEYHFLPLIPLDWATLFLPQRKRQSRSQTLSRKRRRCGPGAGLVRATVAGALAEFSVNPALSTGLLHSILRSAQDCSTQSCGGRRIASMQHQQLGLGAVLPRAQGHNGVGPAVELPGLRHVVDAQDEGQAAREERVSELRVVPKIRRLSFQTKGSQRRRLSPGGGHLPDPGTNLLEGRRTFHVNSTSTLQNARRGPIASTVIRRVRTPTNGRRSLNQGQNAVVHRQGIAPKVTTSAPSGRGAHVRKERTVSSGIRRTRHRRKRIPKRKARRDLRRRRRRRRQRR